MRSREFVLEAKQNVDVDGIVSQIRRNCQPFLSQTQLPMFRGMSRGMNKNIFATVVTSEDRAPRDTPNIIHTYVAAWFRDNVKIPFRKHHTVFTTGSESEAAGYGATFMVFPIGTFDYCWSPKYKDLTDQFYRMQQQSYSANEIKEIVDDTMAVGNYQVNKGLDEAISSRHEIMIYCKSYYILNFNDLMQAEHWYGDRQELYNNMLSLGNK